MRIVFMIFINIIIVDIIITIIINILFSVIMIIICFICLISIVLIISIISSYIHQSQIHHSLLFYPCHYHYNFILLHFKQQYLFSIAITHFLSCCEWESLWSFYIQMHLVLIFLNRHAEMSLSFFLMLFFVSELEKIQASTLMEKKKNPQE